MKVSGLQVFWMIAVMDLGMTLLMTMTAALQGAKQDAWIAMIAAGLVALLIALISTKLALLYPDQTLVEFSQTIMGKWIGKVIVIVYTVQWYTIIPIVLRQFTDLIESLLLQDTPRLPIMIIMIALTVYVTYSGGIEGIARCSEFLGPLIILMVLVVLGGNLNNIQIKNVLPIYADSGMAGIMKGSLGPASYLGHAVEFVMLTPFLTNPRKASKYAVWGVIVPSLFVVLSMVMVILTVGPNVAMKAWYPFFEMTKEISLGFVENLDALAVVIWISSVFIKLSIYMFVTSYGTAQLLKVKNWRNLIWFIAPITLAFAFMPRNVTEATNHYLLNYWVPVVLPVNMIGLPLLLLLIGKRKKAAEKS
ncbi:endospore germination permease [Paenibacillus tarimensis]